jgi:hypothetical protein
MLPTVSCYWVYQAGVGGAAGGCRSAPSRLRNHLSAPLAVSLLHSSRPGPGPRRSRTPSSLASTASRMLRSALAADLACACRSGAGGTG